MSLTVLYTAAHGGFASQAVPLGGGAAVCDHLVEEWTRSRPFALQLITPAALGSSAPSGRDLVRFGERDYARFSRAFERAATEEILRHDPSTTVVLSNDVSEGPGFAALAGRGYRIYTIYHVDVVAYVAAIYLRGWLRAGDYRALVSSPASSSAGDGPSGMGETGSQRASLARAHHAFGGHARDHAAVLSMVSAGEDPRAALGRMVSAFFRRMPPCSGASSAFPATRKFSSRSAAFRPRKARICCSMHSLNGSNVAIFRAVPCGCSSAATPRSCKASDSSIA